MKKQAKGIIALSAVLVALLGGGYAYMKFTPEDRGDQGGKSSELQLLATTADGEGTVLVSDGGSETGVVKKAVIINKNGSLTVVKKSAPTAEGESASYTLEGYTDLKLDDGMITSLVNNGNGMAAKSIVARDCDDTAKYGFDKPHATVEFTYESGNKAKFIVGDTAPSTESIYVMIDGDNNVYAVEPSNVAVYMRELKNFVDTTVLEKPDDDSEPDVKNVEVERGDMESSIYIEYDKTSEGTRAGGTSSPFKMKSPTESYLTVESSTPIITGMFGLTASDFYVIHCKDADIKDAGLSEPFCKVTVECKDGSKNVLLLSEVFADNSGKKCCYGMLEGGNVIYIIAADNAPWLTVQPIDVASKMLITSYVWNITELSASCGSEKADFVIKPVDPDNKPETPSSDDYKVTLNGKEFDAERYRKFFAFVNGSNAEEFALGVPVPEGEPQATIKLYDSYRGKTETYDLYDDSVMRSLIVVDGESKYYCTKAFVSVLLDNIRRLESDEAFVTTW